MAPSTFIYWVYECYRNFHTELGCEFRRGRQHLQAPAARANAVAAATSTAAEAEAASAAASAQAGSGTRARTGTPGISPARRCIPGPPSRIPSGSTRSDSRPAQMGVGKLRG